MSVSIAPKESIKNSAPHVMLISGETSGDAHAAAMVNEMQSINPAIVFSGLGGQEMQKAGVELFFDAEKIAVMGLFEVLKHWGDIKAAMKRVKQQLQQTRPDLLVLVDYPEFNLKVARYAKQLGIKVLFYISPKVWASRPKRITRIGQCIDHMAVIFEFETEIYQQANIPVTFVGNPLVDKVKISSQADNIKQQLGISSDSRLVGLFPGSRNSEVSRLIPVMLDTARLMRQQEPDLKFVMPVAANLDFDAIKQQCDDSGLKIELTRDDLYDVIYNCDAIVTCSGTVTLEIGLLDVPMLVVYKLSSLSYQILKRLVTIKHISLVNIIARKEVVKEYIQDDANAEAIARELFQLLGNQAYRDEIKKGLAEVKRNLGPGEGSKRLAELVDSLVR